MFYNHIRQPAVADLFYPGDPYELSQSVDHYLEHTYHPYAFHPKALIVPHADYHHSGPVAASAYALLKHAQNIQRVILLGPSHRVPFPGIAASSMYSFASPMGKVALDVKTTEILTLNFEQVHYADQAHAREHCLEVQLPFLQHLLGEFELIPLVVGDATPACIGEVLEYLWGGDETLIIISSDLSHYHAYREARHMDEATTAAIEKLQFERIDYEHACGRNAINGLLYSAREHGLSVNTLDLRNSADIEGTPAQVIGYGAYAFH